MLNIESHFVDHSTFLSVCPFYVDCAVVEVVCERGGERGERRKVVAEWAPDIWTASWPCAYDGYQLPVELDFGTMCTGDWCTLSLSSASWRGSEMKMCVTMNPSGDFDVVMKGEGGRDRVEENDMKLWQFLPLGDGSYRIVNKHVGRWMSLDVTNDVEKKMVMRYADNVTGQRWWLVRSEGKQEDGEAKKDGSSLYSSSISPLRLEKNTPSTSSSASPLFFSLSNAFTGKECVASPSASPPYYVYMIPRDHFSPLWAIFSNEPIVPPTSCPTECLDVTVDCLGISEAVSVTNLGSLCCFDNDLEGYSNVCMNVRVRRFVRGVMASLAKTRRERYTIVLALLIFILIYLVWSTVMWR
jgi:hypothetical protein